MRGGPASKSCLASSLSPATAVREAQAIKTATQSAHNCLFIRSPYSNSSDISVPRLPLRSFLSPRLPAFGSAAAGVAAPAGMALVPGCPAIPGRCSGPPNFATSFPAVSRQRGTSILPRDHGVAAADRAACFHSLAPLSFDKSCPHALPSPHAYLPILRPVAQVLA